MSYGPRSIPSSAWPDPFVEAAEQRLIQIESLDEAARGMCASRLLLVHLGLSGWTDKEIAEEMDLPLKFIRQEIRISASAIRP